MINQYPLWKYIALIVVLILGAIYAMPNLFDPDPSVQISADARGVEVSDDTVNKVKAVLDADNITYKAVEKGNDRVLVRLNSGDDQLRARQMIKNNLGNQFVVALNLASTTPGWLQSMGALPMYLGLDLRGGVHFLMEVDMVTAERNALDRYAIEFKQEIREERKDIKYLSISRESDKVRAKFRSAEIRDKALEHLSEKFRNLVFDESDEGRSFYVDAILKQEERDAVRKFALEQNITTLRNRVNELGVAEPVIQQQGDNRIVVQLPGVQDTAKAKEILGATATLEFRLAALNKDTQAAVNGRVPAGTELFYERNGQPILLKRSKIVTGDQIIDAASGLESQNGTPAVTVSLDGKGAKRMGRTTAENVNKPMAVLFIETKNITRYDANNKPIIKDGEIQKMKQVTKEVINVATIREQFSNRFQISGLDSSEEAYELALLLRAGALAAPMDIIEERTVGPSLGQDNIDQGFTSVVFGFVLVLLFMAFYYRVFGMVANVALAMNLVFIVAVLSMFQATLTLPGIAGIVLTVGMAVDANVLIFERIREELRIGNTPQAAIHSGYEKAFATIADANITTLIAAVLLFSFGTGPIKGFAITLFIGIVTSMFTAIVGTRSLINLIYGARRVDKLAI